MVSGHWTHLTVLVSESLMFLQSEGCWGGRLRATEHHFPHTTSWSSKERTEAFKGGGVGNRLQLSTKCWCHGKWYCNHIWKIQSSLKEISPECSLERLMLKLKLQYFGHLMRRADSFEKTLMLGKVEGRRRSGRHRMRWFDGITDSMDMSLDRFQELVDGQEGLACCSSQGHKEWDMTEWLNWTEMDLYQGFPSGSEVKNPPAIEETRVRSLVRKIS